MAKIDIDKFVCSLLEYANDNCEGIWVDYLCSSLQDQGLEYKDGQIVPVDSPTQDSLRERYKTISESEWFKRTHENMSVDEMKSPEESLGVNSETYNKIVDECLFGEHQELTEFENRLAEVLDYARRHRTDVTDEVIIVDAKAISKELLAIAKKEFIDRACEYLFSWNENQVRKFGAKATLSCTDFTISGNDFRKAMEEQL